MVFGKRFVAPVLELCGAWVVCTASYTEFLFIAVTIETARMRVACDCFKLFLSGTLAVLAATYSTRANKKVALSSSGLLMSTAETQSHSKGSRATETQGTPRHYEVTAKIIAFRHFARHTVCRIRHKRSKRVLWKQHFLFAHCEAKGSDKQAGKQT